MGQTRPDTAKWDRSERDGPSAPPRVRWYPSRHGPCSCCTRRHRRRRSGLCSTQGCCRASSTCGYSPPPILEYARVWSAARFSSLPFRAQSRNAARFRAQLRPVGVGTGPFGCAAGEARRVARRRSESRARADAAVRAGHAHTHECTLSHTHTHTRAHAFAHTHMRAPSCTHALSGRQAG